MAQTKSTDNDGIRPWNDFQQEIVAEIEQSQRALKEINLMLEQSQIELNKLAQRNTAITVHLQQVQSQLESLPRTDIKVAYDSALDAQQRLFVMRGQLEKLQSDQANLKRYLDMLTRAQKLSAGSEQSQSSKPNNQSTSLEMLINAQESERQRLSKQMHDGPAQALSNFILQTEIAVRLFDIDANRAKEELGSLKLSAMNTFTKVRSFISDLRPMMLDDLGLVPTVKRFVDTFKEQNGIDTSIVITGTDIRLESYLEVFIFRAIQEMVNNAALYGQATNIKVQLNMDETNTRLSVDDNGKGFDSGHLTDEKGLGLRLIKERVDLLGGTMDIDSNIGQGTRITIQIPTLLTSK
jgi:two-component system, NarL family, sensor histidine kinase DegS